MTTLTTPRLTLRPPQGSDSEVLVRELGNFNVSRWTGRVPFPYGPGDAAAFLAHCRSLSADGLVLVIEQQGEAIGVIGIEDGEIGYWLAEPCWGRGFGKEAAQAVTDHAFTSMTCQRLVASHHIGNGASRRILLGLGFAETGEGRAFSKARGEDIPLIYLELTREAWKTAKERRA